MSEFKRCLCMGCPHGAHYVREQPAPNDNADRYIVVCTDEGVYYIATRRVFATRAEAEAYASTVADSRTPLVIAGRFHQLRFPALTVEDRWQCLYCGNKHLNYVGPCVMCQTPQGQYTPEDRSGDFDGTEDLNDARVSKPWEFEE